MQVKPRLILASRSPRRLQLLQQIGIEAQVLAVDIDESPLPNEVAEVYVQRLAAAKAMAVNDNIQSSQPILAADTIVVMDDRLLGKPKDEADAVDMLMSLSGKTHHVYSAVALLWQGLHTKSQVSKVGFRHLTEAECHAYWHSGEPADKAGAYAVQGLAAQFIHSLHGSYSGVMGLPLFETAELLRAAGISQREV
ncbi:MAG: Maf family protein [gamma proteobacterium symbiont of Bathyaustriella thionipta]|nr:Maf family protein [gamma proteobacterium symbiont of Bathyaustriella thionipta]